MKKGKIFEKNEKRQRGEGGIRRGPDSRRRRSHSQVKKELNDNGVEDLEKEREKQRRYCRPRRKYKACEEKKKGKHVRAPKPHRKLTERQLSGRSSFIVSRIGRVAGEKEGTEGGKKKKMFLSGKMWKRRTEGALSNTDESNWGRDVEKKICRKKRGWGRGMSWRKIPRPGNSERNGAAASKRRDGDKNVRWGGNPKFLDKGMRNTGTREKRAMFRQQNKEGL